MAVPPPDDEIQPTPAASIIETIHVSDGRYRKQPTRFPAARIHPKRDEPLEWLSGFVVDGEPVFWLSAARKAPVVDRRVLSDLERVDIFSLSAGEEKRLGRVLCEVDRLSLAVALIKAEVVMTYVHIESRVQLDKQVQTDGATELYFSGEHIYYTNEENRDPLAFVVKVSKDGEISVGGLAP
jgi:hypothetical protein